MNQFNDYIHCCGYKRISKSNSKNKKTYIIYKLYLIKINIRINIEGR